MGKHSASRSARVRSIAFGSLLDVKGIKTYEAARKSMPASKGRATISGSFAKAAAATTPKPRVAR